MKGMDANTGKAISGTAHLRQSVADILGTPLGSRVMRRDYGSRLFQLVDAPLIANTILEIVAATAEAIDRWEPRIKLTAVRVMLGAADGHVILDLEGEQQPGGTPVVLDGIVV